MVYFVIGILGALCVGVSILAVKVVNENRKMKPPEEDEDEGWL